MYRFTFPMTLDVPANEDGSCPDFVLTVKLKNLAQFPKGIDCKWPDILVGYKIPDRSQHERIS